MDASEALALALRYQLIGPDTSYILVHERAQDEAAPVQAVTHTVASMQAAGWSGAGSVLAEGAKFSQSARVARSAVPHPDADFGDAMEADCSRLDAMDSLDRLSLGKTSQPVTAPRFEAAPCQLPSFDQATPVPRSSQSESSAMLSLRDTAAAIVALAQREPPPESFVASCAALPVHLLVRRAIESLVVLTQSEPLAWVLLAEWVLRNDEQGASTIPGLEALGGYGRRHGPNNDSEAMAMLERTLAGWRLDSWRPDRGQRLARARHALPVRAFNTQRSSVAGDTQDT
jgi:hypothetical protein